MVLLIPKTKGVTVIFVPYQKADEYYFYNEKWKTYICSNRFQMEWLY